MTAKGLRILEVERDSPALRCGMKAGDRILTVNGYPVDDELALMFHLAEERPVFEILKPGGARETVEADLAGWIAPVHESGHSPAADKSATQFRMERRPLGIRVEDFKTRKCNNSCLFCFVDQLPPGARPSLRIKDDDYRLSFLHGNYVTLTNLAERELDRIIQQALSPLYVSVHATDPVLRTRILGRKKADDLEDKMNTLIRGGIKLHTQIVLLPEVNDGVQLERTVFDLYRLYPGIASVAIVPLGLSDHGRARETFKPVTAPYCRRIISQVTPWQREFRREIHRTFAYLADEFYIQGDAPLPGPDHYDDFAQIEDGIGMVRRFLEDYERELPRWRRPRTHLDGTLATGKLFYPFLERAAERFNRSLHSRIRVAEIESRFLGKDITVAGLLAAEDIVAGLKDRPLGDFVIIPQEAVSRIDGCLIDSLGVEHVVRELGRPVYTGGRSVRDFFSLLCKAL